MDCVLWVIDSVQKKSRNRQLHTRNHDVKDREIGHFDRARDQIPQLLQK